MNPTGTRVAPAEPPAMEISTGRVAAPKAGGPWRVLGPALIFVLGRGIFTAAELPAISPGLAAFVFAVLALLAAWRYRDARADDTWRDPAILALASGLGLLLVILFSHNHRLWGDAVHPYSYLVSIAEDHDLDFENNARDLAGGEPSPTFKQYSIGPAFVWMPGYALAGIASRLTGRTPDGWNALYRNAAALSSLVFGWSGLLALYLTARSLVGRAAALLAALTIGSGTFLLGYLAWAPTESHASTFAAASWLVYWALRVDPLRSAPAFLMGALLGFATIQRWQAAVLALFVGAVFARALSARRGSPWLGPAFACLAGAVLLFLPQAFVWKSVFGAWLTIPQGSAFIDSEPRIEGVLFSPRHGLFSWSPALYLALPGFVLLARREPWLCLGGVLTFLATVRANAGLVDWSGGSAFGARRFDLTLPFFGLALSLVIERLAEYFRRRPHAAVALMVGAFALWNLLFASAYFGGAFSNSEAVAFVDQAAGVANELDSIVGAPGSLPAAWYRRATTGESLDKFEGRYLERPYSTVSIRMGSDDRLFLDDGWSVPLSQDGETFRKIEGPGAGIHLPIHAPRPYRLGLRFRSIGGSPMSVELWINDRRVDIFPATAEWSSHEAAVESDLLRRGRNELRIVVVRESGEGALAVSGAWFDPGSSR